MSVRAPKGPLSPEERAALVARGRPVRALPVFDGPPDEPPKRRYLPLAEARETDTWEPLVAVWEITLRCDLACRHCGSRAGRARPDELSTEEAIDLVRQLKGIGTKEVALIGGEAYLRDDWATIIRAITDHGMRATMTTGGRGMNAERARAAKRAGLFSASVSIDGERESHDRLRGVAGSWNAAYAALGHLRDAGVYIATNTQINRLSLRDIPRMVDRLADARFAAGSSSSPSRWAERWTSPTCSSSRTTSSRCSRCSRSSCRRRRRVASTSSRGTTSATSARTRACSADAPASVTPEDVVQAGLRLESRRTARSKDARAYRRFISACPRRSRPTGRLTRAALLFAGAAAVAACGGKEDSGGDGSSSSSSSGELPVPLYGVAPVDAGSEDVGPVDAGSDAREDSGDREGGTVALYGPGPVDAG